MKEILKEKNSLVKTVRDLESRNAEVKYVIAVRVILVL